KIAAARRFFNNAVQEYNTGIQQFPAVLLAGALGFAPKDFFDVGVEGRKVLEQAPQVEVWCCIDMTNGDPSLRTQAFRLLLRMRSETAIPHGEERREVTRLEPMRGCGTNPGRC